MYTELVKYSLGMANVLRRPGHSRMQDLKSLVRAITGQARARAHFLMNTIFNSSMDRWISMHRKMMPIKRQLNLKRKVP